MHLHDTYFVVAHFHFVMMGGTMFAFLGGLHYWWPKITGRTYNETLGSIACLIAFIGFNMTFLTQFVPGAQGMPRRYYNYLDQFQLLHAFLRLVPMSWALASCCRRSALGALFKKPDAPDNPWDATTLEWQTPSPPHWKLPGPAGHHRWPYDR